MLGNIEEKMRSRQQDEMFGCHQQLSGHEFEQNLGDSERQRMLAPCSPWGPKE